MRIDKYYCSTTSTWESECITSTSSTDLFTAALRLSKSQHWNGAVCPRDCTYTALLLVAH